MGILDRFKVSDAEKKRRADKRKREFEARKARMDKKAQEVREGRAAGMTMTEIRAKRMNISADELKKRQLATVLGMAEGMSIFLPAGAAIKAGQLVYKGLKGAKAAKALKDAAAAARTAKSSKTGRSVTVKDKPKPSGAAAKLEQKPQVIPKPGTSVARTTRSGAAAKRMPEKKMKRATVTSDKPSARPTPKPKPTPRSTTKPKPKPNRKLSTRDKVLGGAAVVGATVAARELTKDKKPVKADTPKTTPSGAAAKRMPTVKKPTPKVDKSGAASKRMPTVKKPRTAPSTASESGRKGTPKRTPVITAGRNTGFGPKGNIFPSSAAERAALMKMYGGTGSAAAKAAAAGKQGNITAGRAAYEKAKKDRRKKSS